MKINLSNIATALFVALMVTLPASVKAADYDVLGGTFFMSNGVTSAPIPITGMGTEAPVPGYPKVGKLTDGVFTADFSCDEFGAIPLHQGYCETANTVGPHSSASRTGLFTFPFFGVPVFLYFAETGVDGNVIPHPAPAIDLVNMTADFGGFYASWSGTEFNQGSIDPNNLKVLNGTTPDTWSTDATIADNQDGSYTVNWVSLIQGGAFNSFVGTWTMRICPSPCQLTDLAIAPTLQAVQAAANADTTRTLVQGMGDATVTFDSNFDATGITFNWDATDDALDNAGNNTGATLTIAQAQIDAATPGIHRVILSVTDTNVTPNQSALGELLVKIVAAAPGVDYADADNDGIPNYADSISNAAQLQSDSSTQTEYLMQSSAGSLKLGTTAFCADANSAAITPADIVSFGGVACAATVNSVDETGPTVVTGIGGYFDFEVHGLTKGQSVDVVIPLKAPLPVNAGYRKYSSFSGWDVFDQTGGDTVMSAAGTPGNCPSIVGTEWVGGLIEGYNCMKLSITDGGLNDADGGADGIIKDPGSISSNPDIDPTLLQLGGSSSWPLLVALAAWLGLARRKAFFRG